MSANFNSKELLGCVSGVNTGLSTAYMSNQQGFSRTAFRSHTADKGFRRIDLQEHSFCFDRPIKDEALRETVQAPYIEGRKNTNFMNPTFYSSFTLNQSAANKRSNTPDENESRRPYSHYNSRSEAKGKLTSQTQRDMTDVNKRLDFTVETEQADIRPVEKTVEKEKRAGVRSVTICDNNNQIMEVERRDEEIDDNTSGKTRTLKSSLSASTLEVCNGCYNFQLANEANEGRRRNKEKEKELERSMLEYNNQRIKAEKDKEKARKEQLLATSRSNYEVFSEKKNRNASREKDEDIEIKLDSKNLAVDSLRSLKRYQSMLDKMYENSVKRHHDLKNDLSKSQSYNKNSIVQKEQAKLEEKQKHTLVSWNVTEGEKSMFDVIHHTSVKSMDMKALERRKTSEHNCRVAIEKTQARKSSVVEAGEDPFKASNEEYQKVTDGKSMLDKMYASSMQYWKKQKEGLKDASRTNRENSAKKQKDPFGEFDIKSARSDGRGMSGKSFLDMIHTTEQNQMSNRKEGTRGCADYNKGQGYSQENDLKRTKTLENYYNSPSRKVGKGDGVDLDKWTNKDGGVFHMIASSAEKLEQNRKAQCSEAGHIIRQQMDDCNQRKVDEKVQQKNFKETPLLVCAHNSNMRYCNICNRRVPANKLSKVAAGSIKVAKAKGGDSKKK